MIDFIIGRLHQYAEVADFWMGLGLGFSAGAMTTTVVFILEWEIRRRHYRRIALTRTGKLKVRIGGDD